MAGKSWSVAGAARFAREARISTVAHLQTAPIARLLCRYKLTRAYEIHRANLGRREAAMDMLLGGLGYRRLPCLPAGPVATGMTFDGSQDLAGDADLIAGGLLVEFKAGRGGSPRKDGTRCASLTRADLYQLIGCALMDYSDTYKVRGVGVYAVRFGYFGTWPLRRLADQLAGGRAPQLRTLRRQFAQVLRVELPAYWETRG